MLYDDTINVMLDNVFCFNGFNRFTWFNMDKMTKNDRCLIKTIKTKHYAQTQYDVIVYVCCVLMAVVHKTALHCS